MNTLKTPHTAVSSRPRITSLLTALAVMLLAASSAHATIIVNAQQVGSNVVFSYSGSFNIDSSAYYDGTASDPMGISPAYGEVYFGGNVDSYALANLTGPTNFGPGLSTSPPRHPGPLSLFDAYFGFVDVPTGYVSNTTISGTMTFDSATLASLGMTPGTYDWSWSTPIGEGTNGFVIYDSLTLNIVAPSTVPDTGSTVLLMGLGLVGLGLLRHKLGIV